MKNQLILIVAVVANHSLPFISSYKLTNASFGSKFISKISSMNYYSLFFLSHSYCDCSLCWAWLWLINLRWVPIIIKSSKWLLFLANDGLGLDILKLPNPIGRWSTKSWLKIFKLSFSYDFYSYYTIYSRFSRTYFPSVINGS